MQSVNMYKKRKRIYGYNEKEEPAVVLCQTPAYIEA